ncbi:MAG: glutamate racemase [Pseudomonadota bacterium]
MPAIPGISSLVTAPDPSQSLLHPSPARGRVLVFDSGAGGLTVAREIADLAPGLKIDYAADTGFFPYGDKSDDALRRRLPEAATALVDTAKPDVFVIACNTASTLALAEVRAALDIPVVGTVPAIKPAIEMSETKAVGLLATPGTIGRSYTDRLISEFAQRARVIKHGSIDLVRMAEASARGDAQPLADFTEVQAPMFDARGGDQIDTVVLACTHFPLVRDQLAAAAPRPIQYVDSGAAIARQTIRVLPAAPRVESTERDHRLFFTSDPRQEIELCDLFSRFGFGPAQRVAVADDTLGSATMSALLR